MALEALESHAKDVVSQVVLIKALIIFDMTLNPLEGLLVAQRTFITTPRTSHLCNMQLVI